MYEWTNVDDSMREALRLGGGGTLYALIGIVGALNRTNELLERVAEAQEASNRIVLKGQSFAFGMLKPERQEED